MDSIVAQLLQIDERAGRTAVKAEDERAALRRRIEDKRREINELITKETDERIKQMHINLISETDDRISRIYSDTQAQFAEVEKQFYDNQEHWENRIIEMILGPEA